MKRKPFGFFLFSVLFSIALFAGYALEKDGYLSVPAPRTLLLFAAAVLLTFFITAFLLRLVHHRLLQEENPAVSKATLPYFLKTYLGLVLTHLPVFLGVYPGFFVYDASDELNAVLTRTFTTHHPLLHVLTMGGTVAGVHKATGSWNAGIAVYIGLQALLILLVYAYVLTFLYQRGVRRSFRILSFFFFGVFPPVVMFTLCSAKDGLFTAFFLLLLVQLLKLLDEGEAFLHKKLDVALFVIGAAGMLFYRRNAVYAFLVFVFFFGLYAIRKFRRQPRELFRLLLLIFLPLLIYEAGNRVLIAATDADDSARQEMLTVPIMQLTRTYAEIPESFSGEEAVLLKKYLPEEALSSYKPRLSDGVKIHFRNDAYHEDPSSFLKLWFSVGKQHPVSYLNAWLLTSYGNWYPFAVINVYEGNTVFTFTYTDSSYFGYEVEAPGVRTSFLPAIDRFYRKLSIERFQQEIPVVSLLFAPAFYVWVLAFCALYVFCFGQQKKRVLFFFLPLFAYFLTLLLGPTYLLRYTLIFFAVTPLLPLVLRMASSSSHPGPSRSGRS